MTPYLLAFVVLYSFVWIPFLAVWVIKLFLRKEVPEDPADNEQNEDDDCQN